MSKIITLCSVLIVTVKSIRQDPRSVNVALETSLLFEPKDINNNLDFVKNIRKFVDKIYHSLEPEPKVKIRVDEPSLTNLIFKLGSQVLTSKNLGNITMILRDGNSKYSNILDVFNNKNLRKFVKSAAIQWLNSDGRAITKNLRKFLKQNEEIHNFTNRLDAYNEEDLKKLDRFIKKLDNYLRKNKESSKIIEDWLDLGIFEKYTDMNFDSKVKLLNDIKLLKKYVVGESNIKEKNNKIKLWKPDDSNIQKSKEDVSGSYGEEVHAHHRHSHKNKLRNKHKTSIDSDIEK